jgi:hypothetical protein
MLYQIERQLLKPANHSLEATGDAARFASKDV